MGLVLDCDHPAEHLFDSLPELPCSRSNHVWTVISVTYLTIVILCVFFQFRCKMLTSFSPRSYRICHLSSSGITKTFLPIYSLRKLIFAPVPTPKTFLSKTWCAWMDIVTWTGHFLLIYIRYISDIYKSIGDGLSRFLDKKHDFITLLETRIWSASLDAI